MNNHRIKSLAMLLLLMFLVAHAVKGGSDHIAENPLHKEKVRANSRKLLGLEVILDYDYAGPNVKHDPRGRRGGGGRNP